MEFLSTIEGNADNLVSSMFNIKPNGLEDPSKFVCTYNPVTRIFSITVGADAAYWCTGIRYTPAVGTYNTLPHNSISGKYFCYWAGSTLSINPVDVPWDILSVTQLCNSVYNNTTPEMSLLFDDRHPTNTYDNGGMSNLEHKYHHDKDGTQYISGLEISDYVLNSPGVDSLSFTVNSGVISDEDIYYNISALNTGSYRVLYRSGSNSNNEWSYVDTSITGILDDGTDIVYNKLEASVWSLAPETNANRWINYWVVSAPILNKDTGVSEYQTFLIMGQTTHTSFNLAKAEDPASISWGGMPFIEHIIFGKLTYKKTTSIPSNVHLAEVSRIMSNPVGLDGIHKNDHQTLFNRTVTEAHPANSISYDDAVVTPIGANDLQTAVQLLAPKVDPTFVGSVSVSGLAQFSKTVITDFIPASTNSSTGNQNLLQIPVALYRTADLTITAIDALGEKYQVSKMLIINNSTSLIHTEYAMININGIVASYSVDIYLGNMRILVSPSSANSTSYVVSATLTKI